MFDWWKRRAAPPQTVTAPVACQDWKVFENETFWHLDHFSAPDVLERFEFRNCKFFDCHTKPSRDPKSRSIVRHIKLTGCSHANCSILGSIVDNIALDGLKSFGRSPLFGSGAVFKHVTLSGRISSALLNKEVRLPPDEKQDEWDEANAAFYAACDWAFDIKNAKFTSSFEFRSVPGRLIRRDPETQVLVTRERVADGRWCTLDIGAYSVGISMFLETNLDSTVFAAPRANKKFKEHLAHLELLRSSGCAEPD